MVCQGLSYDVDVVCQIMQSPYKSQLDVLTIIMIYVKATCAYGLNYENRNGPTLLRSTNLDWVGNIMNC